MAFVKSFPLKTRARQKTLVTDRSWEGEEWGTRGHLPCPLGLDGKRGLTLGSAGRSGAGEGTLAAGSVVTPTLGRVRGLWPGVCRAFGGQGLGGHRCQSPGYSQCL